MRKVQAEAVESISDYRVVDAEVPRPGPDEVLVKVAACGVGYVDALVALGRYQVKPSLPHTPGQDVSGWVEDGGDGVADLAVGDRVMTTVRGGFAEFVIAPATSVVKIPSRMQFGEAAAFRMNYVTALHGLRDRGDVKSGETVVVLGAAGGFGAAAIQVAKVGGARVIAVASAEEKRAFCKSLGADETLSTAPEGWRDRLKAACGGAGPDVVFDPVCGPLFEPAFRALAWGGRHLILGFVGGPIPALPANLPLMNVMLLAVEAGLDTCPQEFWARYPLSVAKAVSLPEDHMVFSGMALGYRDPEDPINGWRATRDPVDVWCELKGFS
ncbi:MAG TPA: zinc-binding dehydrogenase [Steroidobacteraceae bacterium]